MASTRIRNGHLYFRKAVKDEYGIWHYLERNRPFEEKDEALTIEQIEHVLIRFPEPHSAHLPLVLGRCTGASIEAVYGALECEFDLSNYIWHSIEGDYKLSADVVKLIQRHLDRVHRSKIIFQAPGSNLLLTRPIDGSNVKKSQVGYLRNALKKEGIDWTWDKWIKS